MSNVLDGKVAIKGNVLTVWEGDNSVEVYLQETEMNALLWMMEADAEVVFSRRLPAWEIFFGPYIKGVETGYIFQVIELYSRDVTTATIPFKDGVDVKKIKQELSAMLCTGGSCDEEEQKEIHEEVSGRID